MSVTVLSRALLPTRFGDFSIVAFARDGAPLDHVAVVRGDPAGAERVRVRVHSECMTGDVLGSLKCDCRDQIEMALRDLGGQERGVLVYMKQEGRGIGLANKIRAYALQEQGLDTVEADRRLGFPEDLRDYRDAAEILRCLGLRSVVLLTNNPRKIDGLRAHGITVTAREPLSAQPTEHNVAYLRVKQAKLGHL